MILVMHVIQKEWEEKIWAASFSMGRVHWNVALLASEAWVPQMKVSCRWSLSTGQRFSSGKLKHKFKKYYEENIAFQSSAITFPMGCPTLQNWEEGERTELFRCMIWTHLALKSFKQSFAKTCLCSQNAHLIYSFQNTFCQPSIPTACLLLF